MRRTIVLAALEPGRDPALEPGAVRGHDGARLPPLDAWVETGAVKSRSEAAALFIREGLGVRESELADLKEALEGVNEAKERLRSRASRVLGTLPRQGQSPAGEEDAP